jgi:copper chaperone NosL
VKPHRTEPPQPQPVPFTRRAARGLLPALALLLAACGDPGTGPTAIKWDRVTCTHCRMVLSDRHHAAQVRVRTPDGRSRAYPFDDLGCALVWLETQPAKDDPAVEVWVSDWRSGDWIDARAAAYVPNQVTPMEYGLGAQRDPAPGALDFAQARRQVLAVERKNKIAIGHLDDPTRRLSEVR